MPPSATFALCNAWRHSIVIFPPAPTAPSQHQRISAVSAAGAQPAAASLSASGPVQQLLSDAGCLRSTIYIYGYVNVTFFMFNEKLAGESSNPAESAGASKQTSRLKR